MRTLLELEELIKNINIAYNKLTNIWKHTNDYPYNQATKLVKDITTDYIIFGNAVEYLDFLNSSIETELLPVSVLVDRVRVKNLNSLLCKIYSYINVKNEKGQVPIKKCLNDLYGLRIITEVQFNYEDVKNLIQSKFPLLKCTKQDKNGYNGIHIYFRVDNLNYQWELQIWYQDDEQSNVLSHQKHKQTYVDWEWLVSLMDKWKNLDDKNNKGGKNG